MDIAHLKEFVTLASHLKLASAARELFMSPSTLSQHITSLEKEMGVELFSRVNGFELTDAGVAALEHAQKILFEYTGLLSLRETIGRGSVRLSLPNYYLGQVPIAQARDAFLATHPGTKVALTTNDLQGDDPIEILRSGASDLSALYVVRGCGYTIEDKIPAEVAYVPLMPFRCVFVTTDAHPLASQPLVTPHDLAGGTLTLRLCPVSSVIADGVTRVLNALGAPMRVLLRHYARNTDAFLGDLGSMFVLWFEALDTSLEPPWPHTTIHRLDREIIADTYLLYLPERLDELQLAYLDAVRHLYAGKQE